MELDFDGVEETADYVSVPAGTYLCQIADVRVGRTRAGDERWGLRLVVAEGEHAGRQAAWDSLVFSHRGRARVRRVLSAFGLPTTGKVTLEPADLDGRRAFVEVRPTEYVAADGQTIRRNEVPYDGYRAIVDDPDASAGGAPSPPTTSPPPPSAPSSRTRARTPPRDVGFDEVPF
jgi:hypothetical protein